MIEGIGRGNQSDGVVIVSGNAVAMPWIDRVPAVSGLGSRAPEAGNALTDVVFEP